jgi:N-methylhydantoinase B
VTTFASVDPVTVEVIRGHLDSILRGCSSRIIRSALSPNITERRDVSTAILDTAGNTIVQFEAAPIHLAELLGTGRFLLENYSFDDIHPGDVFIANDCYTGGGTHLPDVTVATPAFSHGDFVAIVANLAHHVDIGGRPGSAAGGAAQIYEEGLRIPVTRIVERGVIREDVLRLILLNCRMPDQTRGDLLAQIAANDLAVGDVAQLCGRYGVDTVRAVFEEFQQYAVRKLRAKIETVPDGRYEFVDYLDDDGAGTVRIPVVVAIEVSGDDLHVDFTGTGAQTEGNVNLVWAGTAGCVLYALRAALDPSIPPTSAFLETVRLTIPEGTLVNPRPPAGCNARADTCQRVVGTLLGAFARALPNQLPAGSCDSMTVALISGFNPRDGRYYTLVEGYCGGSGGGPEKDGLDAVQVFMSNVANFPIEVAEAEYPVHYRRHQLRTDSGGAGELRGGLGEIREIELLAPVWLGLHGDRQESRPWGVRGGKEGGSGAILVNVGGDDERRLPAKVGRYPLAAGDVMQIHTPGGGGYGNPLARQAELVVADVRNGRVSVEAAEADYRVAVRDRNGKVELDVEETSELRRR